jgi:GT2 family glycosyltransferase
MVNGGFLSYYREPDSLAFLLGQSVHRSRKCWATCNIAYRRNVLDSVGLFDERYKLASWEDNDLGFRASWLGGIKHIYCPEAIVYHAHEQTLAVFGEKGFRNGRGLAVFFKKFFPLHPFLALGITVFVMKDAYLVLHPNVWLLRRNTKEFLHFAWSVNSFKGFIKGLLRCK